jgi:hypothetical protein
MDADERRCPTGGASPIRIRVDRCGSVVRSVSGTIHRWPLVLPLLSRSCDLSSDKDLQKGTEGGYR